MKLNSAGDKVLQAELQQFDEWSFGRKLAHARNLQLGHKTLALVFAARRRLQNGGLDPFQDKREDPWCAHSAAGARRWADYKKKQPQTPEDDIENCFKIGKPEEYVMSTPPAKRTGLETPPVIEPPGLKGPKLGTMTVDSIPRPKKD